MKNYACVVPALSLMPVSPLLSVLFSLIPMIGFMILFISTFFANLSAYFDTAIKAPSPASARATSLLWFFAPFSSCPFKAGINLSNALPAAFCAAVTMPIGNKILVIP